MKCESCEHVMWRNTEGDDICDTTYYWTLLADEWDNIRYAAVNAMVDWLTDWQRGWPIEGVIDACPFSWKEIHLFCNWISPAVY